MVHAGGRVQLEKYMGLTERELQEEVRAIRCRLELAENCLRAKRMGTYEEVMADAD